MLHSVRGEEIGNLLCSHLDQDLFDEQKRKREFWTEAESNPHVGSWVLFQCAAASTQRKARPGLSVHTCSAGSEMTTYLVRKSLHRQTLTPVIGTSAGRRVFSHSCAQKNLVFLSSEC